MDDFARSRVIQRHAGIFNCSPPIALFLSLLFQPKGFVMLHNIAQASFQSLSRAIVSLKNAWWLKKSVSLQKAFNPTAIFVRTK